MPAQISFFLLLMAALAGCSDASSPSSQPTQWRFALEEIEGSVQGAYARRFGQLVEEKSGGEISITIYPYGALGTSAQVTEQVQSGALQFAFASPGHLGAVVPEAQIFSLHFLFPEDEGRTQELLTGSEVLYGTLGQAYREKNLVLLAIVQEGPMVWTGNRPLHSPEDFAGFKMRTMPSPVLVEAYQAYGANPTPMPYGEVYSALQLKMIDGQVNPVFAIEEMSFYEVQKAMTFAGHLPFISTVVASPAFYDGLSEERRRMLQEVKQELDGYIFELQQRYNAERLARIRAQSEIQISYLTAEQRQVFRRASLPVRKRFIELAGPRGAALLEAFLRERDAAGPSAL